VIRIEFSNIQTPEIVAEYGPGQGTDFSIRVPAASLLEQEQDVRDGIWWVEHIVNNVTLARKRCYGGLLRTYWRQ